MDDNLLHDVVAAARKAGADAAEAVFAERQSLSVSVRLAPEDPYASLAPSDRLAKGPFPELDLIDAYEPTAETLETQARIAEAHAREVKGVTNSDGGSGSWSSSKWALVTSEGFHGVHAATGHSVSASAIAGEGAGMERGGEGRSTRHFGDLPAAGDIGMEAGRQAVARLNPRKIATTTAPVIFENRLAMSLIGPLLGAISGPSITRGSSFLKDKLGQQIFAKGINLTEDPHRVRGLGSAPFDDEGVATQVRSLIDDGVLTTWLLNSSSAKQLGLATTGHASRGLAGPSSVSTHNLTLQPGAQDLEGLMKDAGTGLLVTSMFGPSLNGNTGDWSVGCSGVWFENGESTGPVTEITVAGNLIDIYARLVPGSDLQFRGASNSPSILVDALAIAGK
jgi:PmbA protein